MAQRVQIAGALAALCIAGPLTGQERCTLEWDLAETLRLGSVSGPDALGSVLSLTTSPAGEVYIAQSFVPHVSVFSEDGQFVRTIGRRGGGPGEFDLGPLRVGWVRDTLWVSDLSAIHFFDGNGRETRQVKFATSDRPAGSRFTPGVPLADNTYLGARTISGRIADFFNATRLSIPRFSESGEVRDTLAVVQQRSIVKIGQGFTDHPLGDWQGISWLPFAATPDGSGIVLVGEIRSQVRPASFDLIRLGVTGDTLLRSTISYDPVEIRRSDVTWITDAFAAHQAGDFDVSGMTATTDGPAKERARRAAREAIEFPSTFPPVRRVVAGTDGSIWLLRELDLPDLRDRWEVYGDDGTLEGVVWVTAGTSSDLPWQPRLRIFQAARDEIWGSSVDELGVPRVHRYRVVRTC